MVEKFDKGEKGKGCACPWKMCMCHMQSLWTAFIVMFLLNFVFLYVVHAVVMHFAMGSSHAEMMFFGAAAFLGAAIMAWHKRCMDCSSGSCEK